MNSLFTAAVSKMLVLISGFLAIITPFTAPVANSLSNLEQNASPRVSIAPTSLSETTAETLPKASVPAKNSPASATQETSAAENTTKILSAGAKAASMASVGSIGDTATSSGEFPYFPPGVNVSNIKAAIVNIICVSKDPGLSSMTASGVMIDPQGIILTNAHVAQYFLLADYMEKGLLRCAIRGENPAKSLYTAELLYVPAQWLENNATLFVKESQGNGMDDFAFLRIIQNMDGNSISAELPYLPPSTTAKIKKGDQVIAAAYPAEFIDTSDISKNLYDLSISTKIDELLTFKKTTVDLFRMKGSIIAQKGSSGGAIVDADGDLIGIIATASEKFYDNERNLYALTIPYINRELEKFTGSGIEELLSGNLSRKAVNFSNHEAPALRRLLEAETLKN